MDEIKSLIKDLGLFENCTDGVFCLSTIVCWADAFFIDNAFPDGSRINVRVVVAFGEPGVIRTDSISWICSSDSERSSLLWYEMSVGISSKTGLSMEVKVLFKSKDEKLSWEEDPQSEMMQFFWIDNFCFCYVR